MAIACRLASLLSHHLRDQDLGSVTEIAPNRSRYVQVFFGAYIRVIDRRAARALTQRLADQGIERHKPRHGWAGPNRSGPLKVSWVACVSAPFANDRDGGERARSARYLSTRPLIFSSHCQSTARMPPRRVAQGGTFQGLAAQQLVVMPKSTRNGQCSKCANPRAVSRPRKTHLLTRTAFTPPLYLARNICIFY